jgi:23S rRNA (adenine2503-C2)-methyltransferase
MKRYILDLTSTQFKTAVRSIIRQEYRINQIIRWIYVKKVTSFEEFTNISKELRKNLDKRFLLRALKIVKKEKSIIDGTIKYTFQTIDKKCFFAVFLISKGKSSVCISSQVGCPVMCAFCSSGKIKFVRNLSRGEIIEQILQIENDTQKKISGVMFMGMGEPTLNFNNVTSVVRLLLSNKGVGIGKRHITISSVGVVPAIKRLADDNLGIRLAVSLHAVNDEQRKKIIPNSFGFSIKDILNASRYYLKKTKSRLTVEYILINRVNDSAADAHNLARLLKYHELLNSDVQVNLISLNPITGIRLKPSNQDLMQKFKNILRFSGITVNIRPPKGADINAACGQLGY